MNEAIKKLLHTTKDGRWYWETDYANDKLELDDEDIDFDRIPEVIKLLKPATNWKDLDTPLEAARILASWGNEEGLEYLEYVVDLRPDNWGVGEAHHLRGYDTTYEWIGKAAAFYTHRKRDNKCSYINVERVRRIFAKCIKLAETQKFEPRLNSWINITSIGGLDNELHSYFRAILNNETFHHWKVTDAVKFFIEYDPDFLDKTLNEFGKKRSDYAEASSN